MSGKKAKIHRKILRDNIRGVTDPAIKRMCRRAGVKRISGKVYDVARGSLKARLEEVLKSAVLASEHARRKTVNVRDVLTGIEAAGGGKFVPSAVSFGDKIVVGEKKIKRTTEGVNQIDFRTYIYKVLKQVHPDLGINGSAIGEINSMIYLIGKAIADQAEKLVDDSKKKTITSRDIQSAMRMVFPGEVAKHAVSEGTKAVTKYNSSTSGGGRKGGKALPVNQAARAGLQFAPARVNHYFKSSSRFHGASAKKIGAGAPVYLAAVLEYIAAEIIELSGNAARDTKKVRIAPRFLMLAIKNDEELKSLFDALKISLGATGVLPDIHPSLLPEKTKSGKTKARSRKGKAAKEATEGGAKPHRFRPGTVALREIKKQQNSTKLMVPQLPFRRLIREVAQDFKEELRFTAKAFHAIQEYIEAWMVMVLTVANKAVIMKNRVTIKPADIHFATEIGTVRCGAV